MIRVAVVDDNEKDCERLIQYLRRYENENSPGMDIRVFREGEDFLADYTKSLARRLAIRFTASATA